MTDIPGYDTFIIIDPIAKGWSGDKKYCVETADGLRMLLRLSDISELDLKSAEYCMMERAHGLGIPTPQPLGFGLCDDGKCCYSLSGWLDGEDAEKALPLMSDTEQYAMGLKAGETLRKIHALPVPANVGIAGWQERYFAVIDERIEAYRREGTPFKGNDIILGYLEKNRNLLHNRPQCYLHGDFHEGNLMVGGDGELYIFDFLDEGFGNYGDPWYDFKTFGENDNAYFSTGLVRGYFNGEPPQAFWDALTYYVVTAALTSIVWTKYHKPEELPEAINWNERNAQALSEGRSPLAECYLPCYYIQWVDGITYKLKAPFDFSFLGKYGKAFKVFDDQDSGNICFGMADGENKYFVKFAGAQAARANVSAEEAVERMKSTVPIYRDLAHPVLTRFIGAEEIGGGFAMAFEWTDAECMGRQYPLSRERFMQMPLDIRLRVFDEILGFHAWVSRQGYVAVDFYDGCIMYDFNTGRTILCDIELYAKTPYNNPIGRMWGSSRFMSPEEFELGAAIDEITNVYTMGATAFALFGDERDRSVEKWKLSKKLYDVAKKAVSDDRNRRQRSIRQLIDEWKAADDMSK